MNAPHWRPAYIGVGSNLDSPGKQVQQGIAGLADLPQSKLVLESGTYKSAPMGPVEQPDFVNAVVAVITRLAPHDLLSALQSIEQRHGRDYNVERWGPRTLDLDLLAYAGLCVDENDLTLPHPGVAERNFVLLPWNEISPHYRVPGLSTVTELMSAIVGNEPQIERLG